MRGSPGNPADVYGVAIQTIPLLPPKKKIDLGFGGCSLGVVPRRFYICRACTHSDSTADHNDGSA